MTSALQGGRISFSVVWFGSSHADRKEFKATKTGVGELPLSQDSRVDILIHGYTESSFRSWVLNLTDGEMLLFLVFVLRVL